MIMVSIREIPVEKHPWPPFLPANARILMLGSFPPKPERWCMDFFYPNWLNDMWRIMGEIFYADKDYFTELPDYKRFDRRRIEIFLREKVSHYMIRQQKCVVSKIMHRISFSKW